MDAVFEPLPQSCQSYAYNIFNIESCHHLIWQIGVSPTARFIGSKVGVRTEFQ